MLLMLLELLRLLLLLLRMLLLQAVLKTGLHLRSSLLNERLLRSGDHAADHVAADGSVDSGRHVAQVPLVVLNPKLGSDFMLQRFERLGGLGYDGHVPLLAKGHLLSPPRSVLCLPNTSFRQCECWKVWDGHQKGESRRLSPVWTATAIADIIVSRWDGGSSD